MSYSTLPFICFSICVSFCNLCAQADEPERDHEKRIVDFSFENVPIAEVVVMFHNCGYPVNIENVSKAESRQFHSSDGRLVCWGDSVQTGTIQCVGITRALDSLCRFYPKFRWKHDSKTGRWCVFPRNPTYSKIKITVNETARFADIVVGNDFKRNQLNFGCDDCEDQVQKTVIHPATYMLPELLDLVSMKQESELEWVWFVGSLGGICILPVHPIEDARKKDNVKFDVDRTK